MSYQPLEKITPFAEPLPNILGQPPEFFAQRANVTVLHWPTVIAQMNAMAEVMNANAEYLNSVVLFSMVEVVASRVLTISDSGFQRYIRASGTVSLTFPASLPIGAQFNIRCASGSVNLVGDGVTLHAPRGGSLRMLPGDMVTVVVVAPGVADVLGSTEVVG